MGFFSRKRPEPTVVRRGQVRRLVDLMVDLSDAILEDEPANPSRGYERAAGLLEAAVRNSTRAEVLLAHEIHDQIWP